MDLAARFGVGALPGIDVTAARLSAGNTAPRTTAAR